MSNSFDTIVIGAGAAGLSAGVELARAGQRVVIVEARTRIGGRIMTHHHDAPLELGAEFIHGLPETTWNWARDAAVPTVELGGMPFRYREGILRPGGDEPAHAFETLEHMSGWLASQPPGVDVNFEEFLRKAAISGEQAEQASRYVEGFNAADQRRISAVALDRQKQAEEAIEADRLFHLPQGYDALPKYLAEMFERAGGALRLGHCVQAVDWRRDVVTVSATNATAPLAARRLVITVPLGVLQAGSVRFSPVVPGLSRLLSSLVMGPVLRVALLFRRAFWATAAPEMLFLFSDDMLIPTWWSAHPSAAPLLTGWIGGARALKRIGATRGQELVELALAQLTVMFGAARGQLRNQLLAAETHDWTVDPYAQGAYSYATVGGVNSSAALAQPIEQTLFFAGEHTDTDGHWGTVHAALASGRRAAENLLNSA